MNEIIPNGSSLTDDDLNEIIVPRKSTKTDLIQLEVEDIQTANASQISTEVKEGGNKHSTPLTSEDALDLHSEEILDFMSKIIPNCSSLSHPHRRRPE